MISRVWAVINTINGDVVKVLHEDPEHGITIWDLWDYNDDNNMELTVESCALVDALEIGSELFKLEPLR